MMTRVERVMLLDNCTEAEALHRIEVEDFSAECAAEAVVELPVTPEEEEAFNSMRGELR
jgi:hypothetical protein